MLKAVFFDFDGVIVDSMPTTILNFKKTLRHFGLSIPTSEEFCSLLGVKTSAAIERLVPDHYSDKQTIAVYQHFKQVSLASLDEIGLISGGAQVLKKLSQPYQLALVTNRGKAGTTVLLNKYHLNQHFGAVVVREDITAHKPEPEGILKAMETLGVTSQQSIYVGDMPEDVRASHQAKIPCILISHKYTPKHTTSDYKLKSIKSLPEFVKRLG